MEQWNNIKEILKNVYTRYQILDYFEKDELYLKNAFEKTEKLWKEQFYQMEQINFIMISEAPLFGNIERYIYNPETAPSSFFHYNDLEAFPYIDRLESRATIKEQKEKMFLEFKKMGFIILDLFPLALNQSDTAINFRHMKRSLYNTLLRETAPYFLIPKLELCMAKFSSNTHFLYRYKKLFKKTDNFFESTLKQITNKTFKIDTINGENMSLDRVKLKEILSNFPKTK